METYTALLQRARERLPHLQVTSDRFQVPEPDVMIDGRTTIIRNLQDLTKVLRREPKHLLLYMARELGCPSVLDLPRGVLKSRLTPEQISQKLKEYTEKYVICSECKRPDTQLKKAEKLTVLLCEACGAQRPITVRRVIASDKPKLPVEVGQVYPLTIEDVGRRGDGVAKKEGFVIFITGANQRGKTVQARITKVLGSNAYAVVVP